jgi:hypothetical protein
MSEGIGRDGDVSSDDFPLRDGCNSESIRFAIRKLVSKAHVSRVYELQILGLDGERFHTQSCFRQKGRL